MHPIKLFAHSLLLLTVSAVASYPGAEDPLTPKESVLLQNSFSYSYDDIFHLLDEVETGAAEELYTEEGLDIINRLLTDLARQGALPQDVHSDSPLESDVRELLENSRLHDTPFFYDSSLCSLREEALSWKEWFKNKWDRAKKFVKKYRKAILAGAATAGDAETCYSAQA